MFSAISIRHPPKFAVSWRSIIISRPARLRVRHRALHVEQDQVVSVPLEDIAVIVLAHPEITLSHPVLSACADHKISLFSAGRDHHPNGVFLPYLQHSRSTRLWRLQQRVSRPLAKQIWAAIVRQKIRSQAQCLILLGRDGANLLNQYSLRVRSGDSTNMESIAALHYFSCLFGQTFSRKRPTRINAMLNYGYAVTRGAIAREIVKHGLHPSLGLFHDNEQNSFNLADDFIELFRPLVDLYVASNTTSGESHNLSANDKSGLINLLNVNVKMPRGIMSALSAADQVVESVARVYEDGSSPFLLELPQLIGLDLHVSDT